MTVTEQVLAMCADWMTITAVQEATGFRRESVKSAASNAVAQGRMESRWTDGVGTEYRATGKPLPRRRAPRLDATLTALAGGPKTAAEIAAESGCTRTTVCDALRRLESKGKVRHGRCGHEFLWWLA